MSIHTGYDAKTGHMDFSLALREMKKGTKVRRASWPSDEVYLCVNGERLEYIDKGTPIPIDKVRMGSEPLLATDWEEVL